MPYKDLKHNLIMFINEFLLIISSICLFTISFYDSYEYFINYIFRDQLGGIICGCFLTFLAFNSFIAIILIFHFINQIYFSIKDILININAVDVDKLKIVRKEII